MRKLLEQLEEMHMRVAETATSEETLVKALGAAIARLDEQLLQDVRHIADEHEHRRTAILVELQGLAGRIGMFQVEPPAQPQIAYAEERPAVAGDWREATRKIAEEIGNITPHQPQPEVQPPRQLFPHERLHSLPRLAERRRRAAGG